MLREINGELAAPRVDELGDEVLTHAYDRFRIEGAGHRVIEVGGRRYISAVTPITSAGRNWSTMIVVPEDDFVGFVARNNRKALWMSLVIVAVASVAGVAAGPPRAARRPGRAIAARSPVCDHPAKPSLCGFGIGREPVRSGAKPAVVGSDGDSRRCRRRASGERLRARERGTHLAL